jgi:hypothetical protein
MRKLIMPIMAVSMLVVGLGMSGAAQAATPRGLTRHQCIAQGGTPVQLYDDGIGRYGSFNSSGDLVFVSKKEGVQWFCQYTNFDSKYPFQYWPLGTLTCLAQNLKTGHFYKDSESHCNSGVGEVGKTWDQWTFFGSAPWVGLQNGQPDKSGKHECIYDRTQRVAILARCSSDRFERVLNLGG